MIPFLFVTTVLIWGTTWFAIALQAGPVPALVSIFYRFGVAGVLFVAGLALSGRLRLPRKDHQIWLVAQALCLFSLNFICFYYAVRYIPSGLESVIFSMATIFNAINARIFYKDKITKQMVLASILGICGLVLLFGRDVFSSSGTEALTGAGLAMLGTLFFSFGNMVSRRNSQMGISPITANAWGMCYGALILLALITLTGTPDCRPGRRDLSWCPALSCHIRLHRCLHHLPHSGSAHRLGQGGLHDGTLSDHRARHIHPVRRVYLALDIGSWAHTGADRQHHHVRT